MPRAPLNRRIAVTGMGIISPLGLGLSDNWAAVKAGKSGIGPITRFDASAFPSRVAGEVKGFDPERYIEKKEIKKMDTFIHYSIAAASMAVEDSGLKLGPDMSNDRAERVGVLVGTGIGGLPAIERYHEAYKESGPRKISPFFIPMVIANLCSGQISIRFGAKGPNLAVSTACSTGTHAIGDACRLIQRGEVDVMIAGGSESVITPLAVGGFSAAKALSTSYNDTPEKACKPFDLNRDGFVIGEGAGVVVLEDYDQAVSRGARIYAEVAGYGTSADAFHITAPPEDGNGAARCMSLALKDAGASPESVGYINAHATSTMADAIETAAIKTVFGDHARKLAVSSTKSMTGHLLGAAGGVEAIFTAMAIYDGVLPPTINYETPDPACDLDYVTGGARKADLDYAMSNSFGFGGTNASVLFRRAGA